MALYRDPTEILRRLAAGEVDDGTQASALPTYSDEELRREGLMRRAERQSESRRALQQGVENLRAGATSAKGLARILTGNEEGGLADLERAQRTQAEAAEFGPRVQQVEDIDGVGSALEYARNMGLQQVPNIALTAGTGLLGGLARVGAGTAVRAGVENALARTAASKLAERAGESVVKKASVDTARRRIARQLPKRALAKEFEHGAKMGGAAGGSLLQASLAPEVVLDDDPSNTASVRERAAAAAVGAVATGALEALPVAALFRRYGLTGAQEAVTGGVLARMAKQGLQQGGAEAATELAQTVGERLTHRYVNDNVELVGPEAYSDYVNAMAGGFVGGSLFGAPAGLRGAKSDSPAGRRYADTFKDYMGRFKRTPAPEGGAAPAARPRPGERVSEGAPVVGGEILQRAQEAVQRVGAAAPEVGKKAAGKAREVMGTFKDTLDNLRSQTDTNNSVTELLDAEPFGGVDDDNGFRIFNKGQGIGPAMDLIPEGVNPGRIAADLGIPLRSAIAASMVDDLTTRRELVQTGALDEAAKAIAGADPKTLDNDKITAFQNALGPEGSPRRKAFNRVGATAWALNRDEKTAALAPEARKNEAPTRNQQESGIVDDDRPLYDPKKAIRKWAAEGAKPLADATDAPRNSIVMRRPKDGAMVALSGRKIGQLIQQARSEDATYGEGGTSVQVAKVLADFVDAGYKFDMNQLKPLELASGWKLTPAHVRQLTSPAATLAAEPVAEGKAGWRRQAALTAEYGQDENRAQEAKPEGEMAEMADSPALAPRERSPEGMRASIDERSDPRARRVSEAQAKTDKAREKLDNLLRGVTGVTEIKDEDHRRKLTGQAMRSPIARVQPTALQASAAGRDVGDLTGAQLRQAMNEYAAAKDEERRALRPKRGENTRAVAPDTLVSERSPKPKKSAPARVRITEGETADAPIDTEQARAERAADKVPELDDILEEANDGARPTTFDERREQYKALRAKLQKKARGVNQRAAQQELAQLEEAAEAFGKRSMAQAVKRRNKANKAYFAEWNKLSQPEKVEVADALGVEDVNATAVAKKLQYTKKELRDRLYEKVANVVEGDSKFMPALREYTNANGAYYAAGLTERATPSENTARAREANPMLAKVAPKKAAAKKVGRSDVRTGKFQAEITQALLTESDVNFSPSETPLFAEFDRLRAAAAVRYREIAARDSAAISKILKDKYGKDTYDSRTQESSQAVEEYWNTKEGYTNAEERRGGVPGPIKAFLDFRAANSDALRSHPTIKRLYERDLQRRLDNGNLPTIERMAVEFELAALRGGFTAAWRAGQLEQKLRRIEKYRGEEGYASNTKLKAIVEQIEKEVGLLRQGDPSAVVGMNAREYSDVLVPILPNESDVNHDVTSSAVGVATEVKAALKSRSRRGLWALKNKVANSSFAPEVKSKLYTQIDEARAALGKVVQEAGRADLDRNSRRTVPIESFGAVRDILHDGKTRTLEQALKDVRSLASPDQEALIDTLIGMRALRDAQFVPASVAGVPGAGAGTHLAPTLNSKSHESTVTLALGQEAGVMAVDPIAILLHEAVHAATTYAEQNDRGARRAVVQMLEHAREHAAKLGVDPDTFYGLAETQEFLAESFTNPELQNLLKQMPARNTERFVSLWEEFKDFVRTLLGLGTKDATLLDEVFTVGLDMARTTAAKREQVFNETFGDATDTNHSPGAMAVTPASGARPSDYVPLLSPENRRFLDALFRRGDIYRQIKAAIPERQQAAFASADRGPSMLINVGLGLALRGKLDVRAQRGDLKAAVQELWEKISSILQIPSKAAYGRQVLANLNERGASAAAVDVREQKLTAPAQAITRFVNSKIAPATKAFVVDMNQRMRTTGVPALTQLATLISQRTGEFRSDRQASYEARKLAERNRMMNDYFKIVRGWKPEHAKAVQQALQSGATTGLPANVARDTQAVRDFYGRMREYLVRSGVLSPTQARDNFFPVAIDPANIVKYRDDFMKLFSAPNIAKGARARDIEILRKRKKQAVKDGASKTQLDWFDHQIGRVRRMTPEQLAESWFMFASTKQRSTQLGDISFADGEHRPSFRPENQRLMDFVYSLGTDEQKQVFAKFQDQNMDRVTVMYIDRAVRRGEWERLGLGTRLEELMKKAEDQGATPQQLQMAHDYVDQVMGSYATDWHPWIKKITDNFGVKLPDFDKFRAVNSALVTYQNLRLLPLALMSSLIDPLGVSVRSGGKMQFAAYRDALRAMRDKHGSDGLRALAEDMGIIERHAVSEALIYLYGGASDPTGISARINAALFKYNGLEYVTKFSRLAALSAGQRFLLTHRDGASPESTRYLRELGLSAEDIEVSADGQLLRNPKIDTALTRFVDEAVVRPTATQRPGWHNDPHFMLAAQYKGYLYSFFNTISRRALVELENSNPRVLAPLLMYLPVTALGEMMRDMAQGDDDDRDALAYMKLSIDRSGLLGPKIDLIGNAGQDLSYGNSAFNSLTGPTGQQLGQAYDAANGRRSLGNTFVEALPASALFEDWVR